MIFSDIRVDRMVIDHSRPEAGWLKCIINLTPAVYCGIEVAAGHLTVLTPGREYRSILAKRWHSIEIIVSASVLADEGLRLPAHLAHDPRNATISLPIELVGVFRRLARVAFGRPTDGPIRRMTSATGVPTSALRSANAICSPVNFDFFMQNLQLQSALILPDSSHSCWWHFPGQGHPSIQTTRTPWILACVLSQNASFSKRRKMSGGNIVLRSCMATLSLTVCRPGIPV